MHVVFLLKNVLEDVQKSEREHDTFVTSDRYRTLLVST